MIARVNLETISTPLKIKLKGRKVKKSNASLTIQNENDMLKVSLPRPQPKAFEPEMLTNIEQAMFREVEMNTMSLRIFVFKRLRCRQSPHISVFQHLENLSNSE